MKSAATADSTDTRTWRDLSKVLLVRLDNLGDVLMTTPAMVAVREALPNAHLTLLTSPSGMALGPHLDMVNDLLSFNAPWMKSFGPCREECNSGRDSRAVCEALQTGRYDGAIIFTVCTQSALPAALFCQMAGIPKRLAYSRENPYQLLTDWLPETDVIGVHVRHEVQRQLDLVASVEMSTANGNLRFKTRDADRRSLLRQLGAAGINLHRPYVVVHPGATAASRRYPAPEFGRAGKLLVEKHGCTVIFTGHAEERDLIEQAQAEMEMPSFSLAGSLNVGELAALIEGAHILISNNSGPVHIAAAVHTPVVDLYALTNPQHTPWRVPARVLNHDVPCRNCQKSICRHAHHDCLRLVEPKQIADAATELWKAKYGIDRVSP